jgi:hypothetical protein
LSVSDKNFFTLAALRWLWQKLSDRHLTLEPGCSESVSGRPANMRTVARAIIKDKVGFARGDFFLKCATQTAYHDNSGKAVSGRVANGVVTVRCVIPAFVRLQKDQAFTKVNRPPVLFVQPHSTFYSPP